MPASASASTPHSLGLNLAQVENGGSGGGGGGSSGGGSSGGGLSARRAAPPPAAANGNAAAIRDRGRVKNDIAANSNNRREVLGYAAVAAGRRSLGENFQKQIHAPNQQQRVWISSGGGRNVRPSTTGGSGGLLSNRKIVSSTSSDPKPLFGNYRRPRGYNILCSLDQQHQYPPMGFSNENGKAGDPRKRSPPSMLVFSGGTAFNGVIEDLKTLTTNVTYVLPVSDDGGSTSEILRVLGGPALGDVRSRCLRLADESTDEASAVKRLLGYRLPLDSVSAKTEWYRIVEGEHELWNDVSGPYRETIRAFLVYFQTELLRHSSDKFAFSNGSIGNFFFAGARLFFQSLDAAIFLFSRVAGIPSDSLVLPVICTNERITLGCELYDGTYLKGQNEISHPNQKNSVGESDQQQVVDKSGKCTPALLSPVKRIFYTSADGTNASHEVFPSVNSRVLERLGQMDAIVYGMGSLYTSICPLLVLRGVGEAVARQNCPKVLLLNGSHDRETAGMSASDFVISICNALNRKHGDPNTMLDNPASSYVNIVLAPAKGTIPLDLKQLTNLGVTQVAVVESRVTQDEKVIFEPKSLINSLEFAVTCFLKNLL